MIWENVLMLPEANWIIDELRYKARIFEKTGSVVVFDADVVKSDTAVPTATKLALQAAARKFEDVPVAYKDYHPGSDGQVLDLVHPSLFPLIYGRSRVLTDRLVDLQNCVESCGKGIVIEMRPDSETIATRKEIYGHNRHHRSESASPPCTSVPLTSTLKCIPADMRTRPPCGQTGSHAVVNSIVGLPTC